MSRRTELVFGMHAVAALLERDAPGVLELWCQDTRRDPLTRRLTELARSMGTAVHRVRRDTLDRMVDGAVHQGVVARYRAVAKAVRLDLPALAAAITDRSLLLVLDGVQDPHNLGACMRTADAAGVQALLVPKHGAAPLTPSARKVACGAAERTPLVVVTNLARALRLLQDSGVRLLGADPGAAETVYDADLAGPLGLVFGGEGRGLRRLTREHCDQLISIPMSGAGLSLNVSVAVGVCLFEAARRRAIASGQGVT